MSTVTPVPLTTDFFTWKTDPLPYLDREGEVNAFSAFQHYVFASVLCALLISAMQACSS
jgi:hypothetical protein